MVTPPFGESPERRGLPREVVYVVDTSGSMHGASIVQAKAALAFSLERLSAEDHFNVIAFASATTALFPESHPAHPAHVDEALDFVAGLEANGGTEIGPAMRLALEEGATPSTRLRQVVFLTDGSVGNEWQLLEDLKARLRGVGGDGGDGGSRVFAIGIGPAPNTFFMRRLAQLGRGTFTHIGDPSEVAEKMTGLFRKLESAVLTDIALELPAGPEADAYPYRVPDLYAGEPVVVALALAAPLSGASVTGFRGDEPWRVDLDELVEERTGIHALWARRAIAEREDDRLGARDEALQAQLRGEIVEIATAHHLVSAFTSLVAVDVTPVRPDGALLEPHALGAALPSAWQADSDFGFAQGATPAALHLGIGLLAIAASLALRRILA
jgi:Ca-activated chloride channel family protein